ncbi:MAG: 3'-5' exonuclease, partial [Candidatus Competibacter sp.]
METLAVIDFETTGLSPEGGARATEVAVVLVRAGRIVDRYPSLMNAKVSISPFIVQLTGITPAMIRHAPPAAKVMRQAAEFIGDCPLIAHNASFDRKVLDAELARIQQSRRQEFACTVLLV